MSTMVDERVVEMRFDNRQFERNVSTSMDTLNKLNKSLAMNGATKGLEEVKKASDQIDFNKMESTATKAGFQIRDVFLKVASVLEFQVARRIIDVGKKVASAFTIEPIKTGFQEYETQINAVQTILANTSSKGKTLEDVSSALDELNSYADKTIYNFTEMTRNIGTFTAAGVDLDTSVQAIKGIANLAAVSGSTSQQASTAMYQLSQALASGTVKLMDWNSVTNAGMGGQVFQDALKETARAHGIAIDEIIDKEGSFRESLQTGWLSADILTETLSKFTGDLTKEQLKTMGYTDEQIEGIVKMGQTANDAATKVKTFTQLFDTLKEAAQSGWTQSWEIIVGDFEEAKELLTDISNVLGDFINSVSESRNAMLQGWKDLGGRTVLIEALRNVFEGLMSVIKPIGEAFSDIFPPITSEQLFALTKGLKELTSRLKLSDDQSAKLKSTFKGLFAVVDIVRQAFTAVWNVIKPLFGEMGKLGNGILGVTASWGDWVVNLNETIKKTDIFNKVLQDFAGCIKNIVSKVKGFLAPVFGLFHDVLSRVTARMEETGKAIGDMESGVSAAIKAMGKTLAGSKFFKLMFTLWEGVKVIAKSVADAIGTMVTGTINGLKDADFNRILDTLNTASFGGIAIAISKFLKSFTEPLEGISDGIVDILDGVRGCFKAYQQQLKAGTLIKIASAIAILAASILVISVIDSAKLSTALVAISTLFAELLGSMAIFNKIGGGPKGMLKACVSMMAVSASIAILAGAMASLGELDWGGIVKGLIGVTGLSAVVVGSAKVLSSGSGKLAKGAMTLVIFAAAIKVLASACGDLGSMPWDSLAKGLGGVMILLLELAAFTKLTGGAKVMLSTGVALIAVAASMKILASAVADFGSLKLPEIGKGLLAMAGTLALVALAVNVMPSNIVATGVGLLVVGAAINIIAAALGKMGGMSWEEIGKGLLTMGVAIAELAIGLYFMTGTIAGSAALLVAAAALAVLTPVLSILGAMSWEGIAKGLITIAGAFAILGIAGAVLSPIIGPILALAGALALVGVAVLAAGAGLAVAGVGINALAVGIAALAAAVAGGATAIVAGLTAIISGIIALIPAVCVKIGEGIIALCGVIADGVPAICTAVTKVLKALLKVLADCVPPLMVVVGMIIEELLKLIVTYVPVIVDAALKLIVALLDGIADNIGEVVRAGVDLVMALIDGIVQAIPRMVDAGYKTIIDFCNGLATAIRENNHLLIEAVDNVMSSIFVAIGEWLGHFATVGFDMFGCIAEGFKKGITDKHGSTMKSILGFFTKLVNGVKEFLGIHSPSTVFAGIGKNVIQGLINGMGSLISNAGAKAREIATNIKNKIVEFATNFRAAGRNLIDNVASGISSMASTVRAKASSIASTAKTAIGNWSSNFRTTAKNLISNVVSGFGEKLQAVKNKASSLASSAKNAITNWHSSFQGVGRNLISGFITGIGDKASSLVQKAKGVVGDAIKAAKNLLGIHSPSKVFAEMGRYVDEGFIVGLESFAGKVANATEGVGRGAMDAMSNAISGAAGIIDSDVGGPVIRPVLDLSQVRSGSGTISGLFGQQTVAVNGVLGGDIGGIANLTAQLDKINQNGNADVVDAIAILRGDVSDLADAITKMRVVMDSGTVVGELLPQIDSGLGRKAALSGRGN